MAHWRPAVRWGIDHPVGRDDSGIWQRHDQIFVERATALAVIAGAPWVGDRTTLGHTHWQAGDALVLGAASAEVLKVTFARARPSQTDDPNAWFQGHGHARAFRAAR